MNVFGNENRCACCGKRTKTKYRERWDIDNTKFGVWYCENCE